MTDLSLSGWTIPLNLHLWKKRKKNILRDLNEFSVAFNLSINLVLNVFSPKYVTLHI